MLPTKTILLIEEDMNLRSVFRDLLEKMDHWVIATPRSSDGVPHVFAVADMADLIVADVTVPGSESVSLTEELLSRRRDLGAILISTDDDAFEIRRRFGDGRTRFLQKPFSIDEMVSAVEEALALGSARQDSAGAVQPAKARFPGSERAGPSRGRLAAAASLASAAMLVIVVGFVWRAPAPPAGTAAAETTVARGALVDVLEPTGDRSEIPSRLRWRQVADAADYRARILAVDDTVLWEGTSPVPSVTLAPEVREALSPGVVYFWTVEALGADGKVVARSRTARFQVVPTRGAEKGE